MISILGQSPKNSYSQTLIPGPGARASPGNVLEAQLVWPAELELWGWNPAVYFNKPSRWWAAGRVWRTSVLEAKPEMEGQAHVIYWGCALRRKAVRDTSKGRGGCWGGGRLLLQGDQSVDWPRATSTFKPREGLFFLCQPLAVGGPCWGAVCHCLADFYEGLVSGKGCSCELSAANVDSSWDGGDRQGTPCIFHISPHDSFYAPPAPSGIMETDISKACSWLSPLVHRMPWWGRPNRGHLQVRRQTPEGQAGVKPDISP